MDAQTFETAALRANFIQCPHCGEEHKWNKEDAFLSPTSRSVFVRN